MPITSRQNFITIELPKIPNKHGFNEIFLPNFLPNKQSCLSLKKPALIRQVPIPEQLLRIQKNATIQKASSSKPIPLEDLPINGYPALSKHVPHPPQLETEHQWQIGNLQTPNSTATPTTGTKPLTRFVSSQFGKTKPTDQTPRVVQPKLKEWVRSDHWRTQQCEHSLVATQPVHECERDQEIQTEGASVASSSKCLWQVFRVADPQRKGKGKGPESLQVEAQRWQATDGEREKGTQAGQLP